VEGTPREVGLGFGGSLDAGSMVDWERSAGSVFESPGWTDNGSGGVK